MDSGRKANIMDKHQTAGLEPSEITELTPTSYKFNLSPERWDLLTENIWCFVTPFVLVIYHCI